MLLIRDPYICSHLYVQLWTFSLWETSAAVLLTDGLFAVSWQPLSISMEAPARFQCSSMSLPQLCCVHHPSIPWHYNPDWLLCIFWSTRPDSNCHCCKGFVKVVSADSRGPDYWSQQGCIHSPLQQLWAWVQLCVSLWGGWCPPSHCGGCWDLLDLLQESANVKRAHSKPDTLVEFRWVH